MKITDEEFRRADRRETLWFACVWLGACIAFMTVIAVLY